jgi:hypothetical protein
MHCEHKKVRCRHLLYGTKKKHPVNKKGHRKKEDKKNRITDSSALLPALLL